MFLTGASVDHYYYCMQPSNPLGCNTMGPMVFANWAKIGLASRRLLMPDESGRTAHDFRLTPFLPPGKRYRFHANGPIDQEEIYKTVRYID